MTKTRKPHTLLLLVATAGYWLVIFSGTHVPGNQSSGGGHSDKVAHFSAFAGLAFLLCCTVACFRPMRPAYYGAILGLVACYGMFDELTQLLVRYRTADPLDWLADMCGAIMGMLIFAAGTKLFRSSKNAQGTTG